MTPIKTKPTFNDMNTVNSAIKMPVLVRYDIPTYPQGKVMASRMATIQISRAELQYSLAFAQGRFDDLFASMSHLTTHLTGIPVFAHNFLKYQE